MADVHLRDLPVEAREIIARNLTHENAMWLAIDAINAREAAKHASYPADPLEALREAWKVAKAEIDIQTDDPIGLVIDTLEVATAALDRGSFDDHDAKALITLLHVAENVLRAHRQQQDEATDRIRAILFPQK